MVENSNYDGHQRVFYTHSDQTGLNAIVALHINERGPFSATAACDPNRNPLMTATRRSWPLWRGSFGSLWLRANEQTGMLANEINMQTRVET